MTRTRLRDRLTYANVMATLALFVALGGTSVATTLQLSRNSVESEHIRNGTIKGGDIRNGSVRSSDLHNGTITHRDIRNGTITSESIRQNTIRGEDIAMDSIERYNIANNAIAHEKIAPSSITGETIVDNSLEARDFKDGVLSAEFRGSRAGGDLIGSYPSPTLRSGAVTLPTVAQSLVDPPAGDPGLRTLGTGAEQAAAGDDPRIPTQAENDALAGTSGTPGASNQYVTDGDARMTNARPPSGGAGGDLTGSYPNPTIQNSAVDSAAVANGSLRLGDMAVFRANVILAPTTIGANSCGSSAIDVSGIFDVQAGDIAAFYPPVDGTDNVLGVVWASGTQDGDEVIRLAVCNNNSSDQSAGGTVPFALFRP